MARNYGLTPPAALEHALNTFAVHSDNAITTPYCVGHSNNNINEKAA